jgi:hypothetical protein
MYFLSITNYFLCNKNVSVIYFSSFFFLSSSFHHFSFSKVVQILGPMTKAQSYNPKKYFELLLIMKENIK